ncbi:Rap1a/Tai family immunity protein [Methylorubrum thiocyanatum]
MKTVIAVALVALSSMPVRAQFFNGNHLHSWCAQPSGSIFKEAVSSYMSGLMDGTVYSKNPDLKICMPESVSIQQARDVFCKYLSDHPEDRHRTAAHLVFASIRAAWPCSRF